MITGPNWFAWIVVAGLLGLILSVAVVRRRRQAREASRPYPCLTFYLGQQEVVEDKARAREKLGANLNVAPLRPPVNELFKRMSARLKNSEKIA